MTDVAIPGSTADAPPGGRLRTVLERARPGARISGERWLLPVGGALAVAGLACIVVGWAGTSHTVLVAGQIPYLVSGGLLGLGLVFLGGFLYFAYWVAQAAREARERSDADRADMAELRAGVAALNRSLAGIAAMLEQRPAARPRGTGDARSNGSGAHGNGGRHLVATRSGTMLHRPDCPVVAGKPGVHEASAGDTGLRPCGICHPLGAGTVG